MGLTGYYGLVWEMVTGMLGKVVPDEISVMTLGAQVANTGAGFFTAFIAIYPVFLIVTGAGYIIGAKLSVWLLRQPLTGIMSCPALRGSMGWLLAFGIFLPIIRHLMPLLAGVSRMSLRQFLLFFIPSSLVWTLHYFVAGYLFADQLPTLVAGVYLYSKITLTIACVLGGVYIFIRQFQRSMITMKESGGDNQPPL